MRKNTIYNLEVISKFSRYSKLNDNYDRLLGDRSLKGFVKINKKPKVLKRLNYLEELHQRYPNEIKEKDNKDPHEFITNLIMKNIETNKNDNGINSNKYYKVFKSQPNENYQKLSIKNYFNAKKSPYQEIISLDPFKYNPNYNAIFKKIPYVHIIGPKEKNKNNVSRHSSINRKLRIKSSGTSEALSINNTNENNINHTVENKKLVDKNIEDNNENSIKLPKVNNKIFKRNENHALRFSKYGNERKNIFENKNENEDNYIDNDYCNSISVDKLNTKKIISVNFDKMMSRKANNLINSYSLKTPSFNRYSPNYDFVKNSPAKISFSYHNLDNNDINKKKLLLNKLIHSYKVDTDFHIFKNDQTKLSNSSSSNSIIIK